MFTSHWLQTSDLIPSTELQCTMELAGPWTSIVGQCSTQAEANVQPTPPEPESQEVGSTVHPPLTHLRSLINGSAGSPNHSVFDFKDPFDYLV